jgi:hypothetical protein
MMEAAAGVLKMVVKRVLSMGPLMTAATTRLASSWYMHAQGLSRDTSCSADKRVEVD